MKTPELSQEELLKINASIKFHRDKREVYRMEIFNGLNGFQKHKLYVLGLTAMDEEMAKWQ